MSYRTIAISGLAAMLSLSLSVSAMAAERALSFGTSGVVAEVKVKSGDAVTKGTVLAVLDKRPIESAKRAADARVATARVVLKLSQQRFKQTQERYDSLSASAEQVEQAQITFVTARSDLVKAQADAAICAWNLDRASLKSPFAGTVSNVPGHAGQVINITAAPGQPVVVINTQ